MRNVADNGGNAVPIAARKRKVKRRGKRTHVRFGAFTVHHKRIKKNVGAMLGTKKMQAPRR